MLDELDDGLNPFSAAWATGHNDTAPTLLDARWFVNERVPMMLGKLLAYCGENRCFVHFGLLPSK